MSSFLDLGLTFDAGARRCDVMLGVDGDLVLDETPVTPMIASLGLDRRARPDDDLPEGLGELNSGRSFVARRGWAGDALDAEARLSGSRLWLLDREKQTDITLRRVELYCQEALDWVKPETGRQPDITVEWQGRGMLAFRTIVDGRQLDLRRKIG